MKLTKTMLKILKKLEATQGYPFQITNKIEARAAGKLAKAGLVIIETSYSANGRTEYVKPAKKESA
jgi:hypothetical protein